MKPNAKKLSSHPLVKSHLHEAIVVTIAGGLAALVSPIIGITISAIGLTFYVLVRVYVIYYDRKNED